MRRELLRLAAGAGLRIRGARLGAAFGATWGRCVGASVFAAIIGRSGAIFGRRGSEATLMFLFGARSGLPDPIM